MFPSFTQRLPNAAEFSRSVDGAAARDVNQVVHLDDICQSAHLPVSDAATGLCGASVRTELA